MDEEGGSQEKGKKKGQKSTKFSDTCSAGDHRDPGGKPVKSRGVKNGEDDDDDCRAAAAADHTERWRGGWGASTANASLSSG
jgi:hypothetical protein